jgi:PAS domain S-box-containing protein
MASEAGDEVRDNALYAYRLLAEESSDIVIVREPGGPVYFASAALEKNLGRTTNDVAFTHFLDLVHPDDVDRAYTIYAVPLPGKTLTQTFRVRHIDGPRRPFAASTIRRQGNCSRSSAFRTTSPNASNTNWRSRPRRNAPNPPARRNRAFSPI